MLSSMRTHAIVHHPMPEETAPVEITASVVPAIDELITRVAVRELLTGAEVVDALLDLRLVAIAEAIVAA
jgi:hypothetical protein